jgi:6-phosphogluconolactonase
MNQKKLIGYVGTYTKKKSEGIYTFTLDAENGKISAVTLAAKVENPTYLTISSDNKFLYSVAKKGDLGGVTALAVDGKTGSLKALNQQYSEGAPPCHVSIDRNKRFLLAANYHKGTIEAYTLNSETGTIDPAPVTVQHVGSGPDKRQEKAHAHFAGFTPDEKYVVAVDLGIDQVITYELTEEGLKKANSLSVAPGSGPRHLAFHPNGKIAYLITEFSSEVIVLQYNAENGQFTPIQRVATIPEDFTENNQGSAIHLSGDGRFVYAANRGHNSIAVFQIDQETFELTFIEHANTEGNWPRDFVLDPTERFIVASNQESDNLVLFARNAETGKLTLLEKDIVVPEPVCVKFLSF